MLIYTSGNSPTLHGIISALLAHLQTGLPGAAHVPLPDALSCSNTSIHFCNALIFQGSDHRFQIKRSLSLEVKLPVISVPLITD